MGEIRTLGPGGDHKQIWDPEVPAEVEAAEDAYDTLIDKGYVAYRVDAKGEKSERMREFDPKAGKIIMIKPVKGG